MKLQFFLLRIIDFFYTPFRRFCPRQVFRYGVSGGANMLLDWFLYFVIYHILYIATSGDVISLHFIAITPHIAAFLIVFPITTLTGFWLARNISFNESLLRGRTQLVRYVSVVLANILINYACLKFFIEFCHFFPTPSKMLTTVITVVFSFFMQKFFTFKA
ncbi:MAG: GtrA family protein [Paludibacteraceae bacterium]|nr:GtrA family protein [Paludibacteraceae bacterium]